MNIVAAKVGNTFGRLKSKAKKMDKKLEKKLTALEEKYPGS